VPHYTPLIATIVSALVLAYVAGMLAVRLRLSPLVGYLIAGVIVGPFTPGYVADQPLANELSEIGVILLMFGVGLHFSLGDLLAVKAISIPGAAVQIAIATLLGMGLAALLGWPVGHGLVFGLALSVASTVVLLRALEDRRLLESSRGRIAIGWLIVEDLAMVLVLVLLPALAGVLGGTDHAAPAGGNVLATLGITLGKVAAFVALMLIVGRRVIPWLLERTAGTGSRELFTLAVLAIALGVAFASAKLFDVSLALGAFFAGMVLNESKLSHEAAQESLPFRDAFAVLFFVSVGMLFDPSILIRAPLAVLGTVAIIVLGKSIAALAIVRAFGRPLDVGLTIATSLAQIGEFSFILAALGADLGLLDKEGRDLILAGAILSICINPLLFAALDRWHAARAAREPVIVDDEPTGPPLPERDHIVLIGFGRVGARVGRTLRAEGDALVVVESDADRLADARALGIAGVLGNAAAPDMLEATHVSTARALIVAIPQTIEAGQIIEHARAANPAIAVLVRAHADDDVSYLLAHGADAAIMGEREIARGMCEAVGTLRGKQSVTSPA
jgi:CPA2 family monovalent cation:H+ antiporter-2